jgi:4-amino-4-deoxy-L-arabinose transferase-like glycosyltransferase
MPARDLAEDDHFYMKFKKGKRAKNHEWKTYLLFFLIILIGGIISISFTGRQTALQSDASDYFKLASEMSISRNGPMSFITQKTYVDIGYPFILSFVMRLFSNNFIVYQLVNYVFWFLSTVFIYKSFNILTNKNKAFWGSLIMACSPIFLTFSAKLYSEPFAALGVAMTIYFFIAYKEKGKLPDLIGVVFGAIIFSFTKSVFVLLVIFALLASIKNKNLLEYLVLGFGILTLITRFYFSYEGGRSDQILITQVIKVRQS